VQATILHLSRELERRLEGFRPAADALQIVHAEKIALPLSSPAYGQGWDSAEVPTWRKTLCAEVQKNTMS